MARHLDVGFCEGGGEVDDKQSTFVFFVMRTGMTLHRMGSGNPTVVLLLPAGAASKGSEHAVYASIYSESSKTNVRSLVVINNWKRDKIAMAFRLPRCQIASAALQQNHP